MPKPLLSGQYLLICIALLFTSFLANSQTTIIANGSSWKYWSNTQANFPAGWQNLGFNDAAWPAGNGELGYGDGDEATCIPSGGGGTLCVPTGNKWVTAYFRKTVNIPDPTIYSTITFNVERDDGFVLYVNGVEVGRDNMPGGAVTWATAASGAIEDGVITVNVPSTSFSIGNNDIAVEVHQATVAAGLSSSSDISFNLSMVGNDPFTGTVTRGPYLQMGNETEITIRWRTSTAQNSRIQLGTVFGTYPIVVNDASVVTEHIVQVTGLTADTKYFYKIGNSVNMGADDIEKFFTTLPLSNSTRKIRIAAFGDCGRNSATYQDQNLTNYQSYLSTNGIEAPDAWILMGDNAYSSGTDAEYTSNFFGIYGNNILKNHKLYPAPGNHDYGNNAANKPSRVMPYYLNFSTPQNAECGGVASNKPNFYSFDIGNIHFLSLDAWGIESNGTHMGTNGASTLKTWIAADLAANTKKWTIAYWHHSPYTKTSHNSDTEPELAAIRTNFISFLETRGVDLIILGHSHGYERSYLLKNYTSSWAAFNPATHAVSTSSAQYTNNASCPYVYPSSPLNHGTVYVVAGSAGASGGIQPEFATGPMPYAVNDAGILYFEVEDNRLDAKMLRRNGTIFDNFTIIKDVNQNNSYTIPVNSTLNLNASWPGNYSWSTSAVTRSIDITPLVPGTTNYTVSDNFGCITDQFQVLATSVLPVDLESYTVSLQKEKVYVKWKTTGTDQTLYYTVERSANGVQFEKLAKIDKHNASHPLPYEYVDALPLTGTSYYRLSETDMSGKTHFFEVRKIINKNDRNFSVRIINNAANSINVNISSTEKSAYTLRVLDINGREINSQNFSALAGSENREIKLNQGVYIIEIKNNRGNKISQKVMVK